MNRRLLLLSSVAMVLAIVLLLDRGAPPPSVEPVLPTSDAETLAVSPEAGAETPLNPLENMTPESFTAILERPLFNPSRTGPAAEAPAVPPLPAMDQAPPASPQGPRAEDFKLVAISAGSNGRVAALRLVATGDVLYLREGQPVQSWSVLSVRKRSVVIGTAQSSIELKLFPSEAGDAQPAMAAPSAPMEPVTESDSYHSYSEEMNLHDNTGGMPTGTEP
jgi:hypothetical protein